MVIILAAAYIAIYLCCVDTDGKYMEAGIKSAVIWCGLLFFQTEILSIFHGVGKWQIFGVWLLVCIFACAWVIRAKKGGVFKNLCRHVAEVLWHNKLWALLLGGGYLFSVCTVPYNWDSMTYHLARIVHWSQNQSVAHYGTNILRQIASPVLHEFTGLHVYLLSGNKDVLLNGIQYMAFLTNGWIVYKTAEKLGCKGRFCKAGLLLFCAMPIAFGEALTTQNDHFAGMWLLAFLYYLLDFLSQKLEWNKNTIVNCAIMGACVGFGYVSKPSVCMGMFVAVVILFVVCLCRRDSLFTMVRLAGIAMLAILLIVTPELLRNVATFGTILHSSTGARQLVGTVKPDYLFINGLKNFAFNLPNIYIPQSSRWIATIIRRIALFLNVDMNDLTISEDGREFQLGNPGDMGHDTAINSIVLIGAVLCFGWCLYRWKKQTNLQRRYTCIAGFLFLLVCVAVRWEPFVSRYMLPYLALLCPMISVQLQDISGNSRWKTWRISCLPVVYCLCITQLSMLFFYHLEIARKLERPEGYFYNYGREGAYISACNLVLDGGYGRIGLMLGENTYEYPIWYMLGNEVERIEHVMIGNLSYKYEDAGFIPDCILVSTTRDEMIELPCGCYRRETDSDVINLYVRAEILGSNGQ